MPVFFFRDVIFRGGGRLKRLNYWCELEVLCSAALVYGIAGLCAVRINLITQPFIQQTPGLHLDKCIADTPGMSCYFEKNCQVPFLEVGATSMQSILYCSHFL